jgi:L-threonylcarbamoyladenylate synthase
MRKNRGSGILAAVASPIRRVTKPLTSADEILMRTVLFICTGNTCRSPMAEAIARHYISHGFLGGDEELFVASAGVQAPDGAPTTRETIESLKSLGIEYDSRSKKLTAQMIRKADLVFCMSENQAQVARTLVADSPQDQEKIVLLDTEGDIEDPIGMGQPAYDALCKRLSILVPQRLKEAIEGVANHSS